MPIRPSPGNVMDEIVNDEWAMPLFRRIVLQSKAIPGRSFLVVIVNSCTVTDVADVAFIGAAITIGALVGALVYKVGGVPITLSTAGGALFSGLFFGWLRSVQPPNWPPQMPGCKPGWDRRSSRPGIDRKGSPTSSSR